MALRVYHREDVLVYSDDIAGSRLTIAHGSKEIKDIPSAKVYRNEGIYQSERELRRKLW